MEVSGNVSLIPPGLQGRLHGILLRRGFKLIHEGKVWQTWTDPCLEKNGEVYRVATDRVSIFDFVLNGQIPGKGIVLNSLTQFWQNMMRKEILTHTSNISSTDETLMSGRGSIVKKLKMEPIECIVRGFLTGTGLISYNETGMVCGHVLPKGLFDGNRLPEPIFTPTTKEAVGHDIHMTEAEAIEKYGVQIRDLSLRAYGIINAYAEKHGYFLADTKFEFGRNQNGNLVLADEIGTPDSSRFWKISEWEESQKLGKSPSGWDKQFIRDWGKSLNPPISKLNPKIDADLLLVREIKIPQEIIEGTAERYQQIQKELMG